MPVDRGQAVKKAVWGAATQLAKRVPVIAELIEGAKAYENSIKDQQREAFVTELAGRINSFEDQATNWYASEPGQQFVKKIVATALNAEYADKLEYLANALVNGPTLAKDDALRMKFVEMVRQLSKSAIDVLVASLRHPADSRQVIPGDIAHDLGWHPALVDACVQELYAMGAYSNVTKWFTQGEPRPAEYFQEGTPAITDITRQFAEFVGPPKKPR